jgi:hypothetical protein
VESDSNVIEHDDVNTDRIKIKEDGYYEFTYTLPIEAINLATFKARVRKNDTTQIPGSYMWMKDDVDAYELSNDFIVYLNSGDYVTLQLDSDCAPGDGTAKPEIIFNVTKLQGAKGDTGAPGAGSSVHVYDDGVQVDGTPFNTLNFINATISGSPTISGAVDITVEDGGGGSSVFGSEHNYNEDLGTKSTTSSSWQQQEILANPNLPAGTYRIGWYCEIRNSSTYGEVWAKCLTDINDANAIDHGITQIEPQDSDNWYSFSGFAYRTISENDDLDVELYLKQVSSGTAYMRYIRMEVWRVS